MPHDGARFATGKRMWCIPPVTFAVLRAAGVLTSALGLLACSSSSGGLPGPTGEDEPSDAGVTFPSTGNQYVDARRCPACHQGPDPEQTGFMSGALTPIAGPWPAGVSLYGPNLTPDMTTGIGAWTDSQITNAILNGIDNQGERLCPEMGHFPDMGQTEVTSILGYLHSLTPVSHQTTGSICPPLKEAPPGSSGSSSGGSAGDGG
jgi:hypothetical protein